MNPFEYVRAVSPADAAAALAARPGARYVAGGTNLFDLMKGAVEEPPLVIDINALPLTEVELRGEHLYLGALTRLSDVAANEAVRSRLPLVAIALQQSASPQIRNVATVGGNLLQRTRCPYFRDVAAPCNKRAPGSGCAALHGENRRQAVLGTSAHCIAAHPSDLAVALVALDATVHVTGTAGNRGIAFREFYRLPGETPQIETALCADELIVGVSVSVPSYGAHSTYVKVRDRAQYDFALVSVAVALDSAAGRIREARVALGGVGTIPWHSVSAERALAGLPPIRETFESAAVAALDGARGHGANEFKIRLAQRALVRALEIAAGA